MKATRKQHSYSIEFYNENDLPIFFILALSPLSLGMVERGQMKFENLLEGLPSSSAWTPKPTKLVESESEEGSNSEDSDDEDNPVSIQNWRSVPPMKWTPPQTAQWVVSLGPRFAVYAPLFSVNRVSGGILLSINEENLLNIGISNFRDRRQLQKQAVRLRDTSVNGTRSGSF